MCNFEHNDNHDKYVSCNVDLHYLIIGWCICVIVPRGLLLLELCTIIKDLRRGS